MLATIGLHISGGEDWSAGVIPDAVRGEVDTEQTGRLGVKHSEAEKKFVYQIYGKDVRDCLNSKEASLGLPSVMEKYEEEGHQQGVLLGPKF